jgi:hypothetical protein
MLRKFRMKGTINTPHARIMRKFLPKGPFDAIRLSITPWTGTSTREGAVPRYQIQEWKEIEELFGRNMITPITSKIKGKVECFCINLTGNTQPVFPGDWIIRNNDGRLEALNHEMFMEYYEEVK